MEADISLLVRECMLTIFKVGAPVLVAALVVGVAVSLVQAVTQVNEQTIVFVPKLLAIGLVILGAGSFMLTTMLDFAHTAFDRMVQAGLG